MTVNITDDFSPKKIINSGQCFRARELAGNSWEFITGVHLLNLKKISDTGYEASVSEEEWCRVWHPYFDLDRDYAAVRASVPAEDVFLQRAAEAGKGIRILKQDHWETLVTFICSQRKSIPAIRRCVEALAERYGTRTEENSRTFYTFPTAEQMRNAAEEDLKACGLGYRVPYVLDAVQKVNKGMDLNSLESLNDAELTEALEEIKGVGIKVASCVSLFSYGRTGATPVDTWIHKIIEREYGGISPFEGYGNNAGIMQQYMFYGAVNRE